MTTRRDLPRIAAACLSAVLKTLQLVREHRNIPGSISQFYPYWATHGTPGHAQRTASGAPSDNFDELLHQAVEQSERWHRLESRRHPGQRRGSRGGEGQARQGRSQQVAMPSRAEFAVLSGIQWLVWGGRSDARPAHVWVDRPGKPSGVAVFAARCQHREFGCRLSAVGSPFSAGWGR